MSKHTPGPWNVFAPGGHECPGIESADDCSIVVFGEKLTSGELCGVQGRTVEEAAANARLIAAAPDFYDAAKDALAGWRYIRRVYGVGWDRVEAALTAAIAKAEGGAA